MFTKLLTVSLRRNLTLILPNNNCTNLVPYGTNLGSTVGFNLNSVHRDIIFLTPYLKQVLVGLILGDGNLRLTEAKINPFFQFNQGVKNIISRCRDIIFLTPYLKQVLVGLILGDGNLRLTEAKINPFFQFNQGVKNIISRC